MWTLLALYLLPSVLVVAWAERRARLRERPAGVVIRPAPVLRAAPALVPAATTGDQRALVASLNAHFDIATDGGPAGFAIEPDGSIVARLRGLVLHSRPAKLHARNGRVCGRQALVQGFTNRGEPVPGWTPYARATDAAQVIRLDRMIRTLHVLNAMQTPWNGLPQPLWLAVHPLHLRALDGSFGAAFADILQRCGRSPADIVLEFTDAERLPDERLRTAIADFRSHGYGIAILVRGDDPDWLARALRLAPDALRYGPAHLEAAMQSRPERQRLLRRIELAKAHGVPVWLSGARDEEHVELALALGADGWSADADLAEAQPGQRSGVGG